MHPPRQLLLRFLDLSRSNRPCATCISRPKLMANSGAMISPVHHRRDNLLEPFPLLGDCPPPQFLLRFLNLGQSNGANPTCTSHRKPTVNPRAMMPPVHHRRSPDSLLQPYPQPTDRLMYPQRLPAI
jgi:hypothetical protein